jgi:hypothetical protein
MSKIEDRLERLEDHIERLSLGGDRRMADMNPAERRARILELETEEVGLGRVPTQEEYEEWLLDTYHAAAYAPTPPSKPDTRFADPAELDETERRELIEAYRKQEAWELAHKATIYNLKSGPVVYNEHGHVAL